MLSRRQVYWSRVNVSKLLRAVETGRHWEAAAFLYVSTGDFDQGVRVMVKHSPVAYNSDKFLEIIQKVGASPLFPHPPHRRLWAVVCGGCALWWWLPIPRARAWVCAFV